MTGRLRVDLLRMSVVTAVRAGFVVVIGVAALVAGTSMDSSSRAWLWLGATVLVAGSVMATRTAVERLADRVAYGQGGDPYSTLSAFVQRIAETVAVDDVLPRVAQTVTQATHSSTSEVRLWMPDGAELREAWPVPPDRSSDAMVDVPLQRRGEQVGVLGVATDSSELSENTRALLHRLAGAAGLALANVRLTYDLRHRIADSRDLAVRLQRSRQRLLDAAADQTGQFAYQVDVHVQQRLGAAREALEQVAHGDAAGLERAVVEATAALEALRDVAAGIFPPTLAENGLQVALETFALRFDGQVRVSHSGRRDRVPSSVETAAYFCSVHVIDDCAGTGGGRVWVDIEQSEHQIRIAMASDGSPSATTVQLIEDRVDATHGLLERRAPSGAAHDLVIGWDLTKAPT